MKQKEKLAQITYEIVKHIGTLRESDSGWTRELNLVAWNDNPAKYDIRDWNEDHTKCGKGLTFTEEEFEKLVSFAK